MRKGRLITIFVGLLGIFPVTFSNAIPPANDCDNSNWIDIFPLGTDCDEFSYKGLPSSDVDLKAGFATNNADYLYTRLDVYGKIDISGANKYFIYFDCDLNSSTGQTYGWWATGADYKVEVSAEKIGLQKFMGESQSVEKWGWKGVPGAYKTIDIVNCDGSIMCAVPRADIGETSESEKTNILFRTWLEISGNYYDDSIPYFNAAPITYTYNDIPDVNIPESVIDNFEYSSCSELNDVYSIETSQGTSSEICPTSEDCWHGSSCVKWTYSLDGLWSKVRMIRDLPTVQNWGKDKKISLWVKGLSGNVDNLIVYVKESDGDKFFYQNDKVLINGAWTKVVIPVSDLILDQWGGGSQGDNKKTLAEVIGYEIVIEDNKDDGSSSTDKSIWIDYFTHDDGSISPSHAIPDVHNFVTYYGVDKRIKDLCKFDLAIIQPANYTASEIAQIEGCGTIVMPYISLGEDVLQCLDSGDEKGPISSGVLTYNGYDSRFLDECTEINGEVDCTQRDGIPDRNITWGGCYVNARNIGWEDIIKDQINKKIEANGYFLDTVGIVEENYGGILPYEWTAPGMISLIAALKKNYPNHYLIGNRGFKIFEDIEPYINAVMIESFLSTYVNNAYKKWDQNGLCYTADIANKINSIRGYPGQTTINVFTLDYCESDDSDCIEESYERSRKFGFIPTVSDIGLTKIYMVNPANDLFAARIDTNTNLLSWIAPSNYVADSNISHYVIKRSTEGPIDNDEKWENANLVSDNIPSSAISFIDNEAPSCQVYYALEAVKAGGMRLTGRLQSYPSPIAIDASTADWDWLGISPLVNDPSDDPLPPEIMENADVDIKEWSVTHNADFLFIKLVVYGNINRDYLYLGYIDADNSANTGITHNWWLTGADYRVYIDQSGMGLQEFMGVNQNDDSRWGWEGIVNDSKTIPIAYSGGTIELAIPRIDIGETAPGDAVNILWRIIPSNDSAPFFNDMPVTYTFASECTSGDTKSCDTCKPGICAAGTQTCDDTESWGGCVPDYQPSPEVCDGVDNNCDGNTDEGGEILCNDALFCNGTETCDGVNGCQPGTAPNCDDGVACTDDSCNETNDSCDNIANHANCNDGNFCTVDRCDPIFDCTNVISNEVCDDGMDNDCDNFIDIVDPDCWGGDPIKGLGELQELINDPGEFPNEWFKENKDNRRIPLSKKINEVVSMVQAAVNELDPIVRDELKQQSIDKLTNDIRAKTDGCVNSNPHEPDNNDWIDECPGQDLIYSFISNLIEYIDSI